MSILNEKELTWDEFMKVEMLVGTIISAENFDEAINSAFKMSVDFGDKGIKKHLLRSLQYIIQRNIRKAGSSCGEFSA